MANDRGTLKDKEPHPSAIDAFTYIKSLGYVKLITYLEAYSSCAIEGNRLGELCGETLDRILHGETVSDRYVLGLAWSLKDMEEKARLNKDWLAQATNNELTLNPKKGKKK